MTTAKFGTASVPAWIPKEDCKERRLYRLSSRNLHLGVYDGKGGFVGIRCKFDSLYPFTEYHWDNGPPFGTAKPLEDLGIDLPGGIGLRENEPTVDERTGRLVGFDKTPLLLSQGGNSAGLRGWYFLDTNEPSQDIRPRSAINKPLFDWLQAREAEFPREPSLT